MTLIQKFATLTTEQKEQFTAVKDEAALEAFASKHGIDLSDELKADAAEYFRTGVLPLDDDELDNVAGGGCGSDPPDVQWKKKAEAKGYVFSLYRPCRICNSKYQENYSIFVNPTMDSSFIHKEFGGIIECQHVYCAACEYYGQESLDGTYRL